MMLDVGSLAGGKTMDPVSQLRPYHSRRDMLKSSALALLPLLIPSANDAAHEQRPMTANGGTDPYPIPWLDKNGSHNQPAGPNLEPSHIYNFKAASPGAAPLLAWVLTIKEIGSRLAAPQRTTA